LQGKSNDLAFQQWSSGFQRSQPGVFRLHLAFHIRPGGIDSFGGNAVHVIEDLIEDTQAQVAHSDFVDIGKGQSNTQFGYILADGAHFIAHVAGRFFDSEKIHYMADIPLQITAPQ